MQTTRGAVLLIAGVLSVSCASAPPAETRFQRELSAAIENMLEKDAARRQRAHARRRQPRPASTEIPFEPETTRPPREIPSAASRRKVPFDDRWRRSAETPGDSLIMPVAAAVKLADNFGAPRGGGRRHQGLDLLAPRGTPVVAAAGGVVSKVSDHPRGGNCLWVNSDDGSAYYYAHLDRFARGVEAGQSVRPGDLLGYVGNTGNASGGPPHLHFEVHRYGEATNPYPLLLRANPVTAARGSASAAAP